MTQLSQPLSIPATLANGCYRVQRRLSSASGALFLATDHEAFERLVVLRALPNAAEPVAQQRLLARIKALTNLSHATLPQIYGFFQEGAYGYLVMEYIEGQAVLCLSNTPAQAAGWGITLCRLLEYLSSRLPPLAYGALSPEHLLIDDHSGEVRLIGLGMAVLAGASDRPVPTPASDLHALAVTISSLAATDATPHGSANRLLLPVEPDPLRQVLAPALQPQTALRATPITLRRQLEFLLLPAGTRTFQAPDGTPIGDPLALAHWCEQHWEEAAAWLYGKLPDQIEAWWRKADMAQALRDIVQRQTDRHAGLDATLVYLDPHGYGATIPQISVEPGKIDWGARHGDFVGAYSLRLSNNGRRYVQVEIKTPGWVTAPYLVEILPFTYASVDLRTHFRSIRVGSKLRDEVRISDGTTTQQIPIAVDIARLRTYLLRYPSPIAILLLICLLILAVLSNSTVSPHRMATRPASIVVTARPAGHTAYYPTPPNTTSLPFTPTVTPNSPHVSTPYPPPTPPYPPPISPQRPLKSSPATDSFSVGKESPATSLNFSYDGRTLAVGSLDGGARLRQDGGAAPLLTVVRAADNRAAATNWPLPAVAFGHDNQLVAVSNGKNTAQIVRVSDSTKLQDITTATEIVSLRFAAEGKLLISGEKGGAIKVWRVENGELLNTLEGKSGAVLQLSCSADANVIAATTSTGIVHIWNVQAKGDPRKLGLPDTKLTSAAVSPNGEIIITGGADGKVTAWNNDGAKLYAVNGSSTQITGLTFSPDGQFAVSGGKNGQVMTWRVGDASSLQTLTMGSDEILALAFSPDGRQLAVSSYDGRVGIWQL